MHDGFFWCGTRNSRKRSLNSPKVNWCRLRISKPGLKQKAITFGRPAQTNWHYWRNICTMTRRRPMRSNNSAGKSVTNSTHGVTVVSMTAILKRPMSSESSICADRNSTFPAVLWIPVTTRRDTNNNGVSYTQQRMISLFGSMPKNWLRSSATMPR